MEDNQENGVALPTGPKATAYDTLSVKYCEMHIVKAEFQFLFRDLAGGPQPWRQPLR